MCLHRWGTSSSFTADVVNLTGSKWNKKYNIKICTWKPDAALKLSCVLYTIISAKRVKRLKEFCYWWEMCSNIFMRSWTVNWILLFVPSYKSYMCSWKNSMGKNKAHSRYLIESRGSWWTIKKESVLPQKVHIPILPRWEKLRKCLTDLLQSLKTHYVGGDKESDLILWQAKPKWSSTTYW